MKRILLLFLGATLLSGCASTQQTSTYTPPSTSRYANEVVMPYDYETAWSKLVTAASRTFFSIENFEKDSGLMTLSFGSSDISRNVDCGQMNFQPYTEYWLTRGNGARINLQGKMNLLVQSIDENSTRVSVNARYILNLDFTGQVYNMWTGQNQFVSDDLSFTFDSNTSDTQMTRNPSAGTSPARTCGPTGEVEGTVINAIEGA